MKFTERQKEAIFNSYISFVDQFSDDLEHKSEISPKEIVYAVLVLAEEQLNAFSAECPTCHKGTMKEMSIYDDMDGMLTCDNCGVRVKT